MVIDGSMTIGVMMTVSYIVGRLSVPFNSFFDSINGVQDAAMSYNRIEEVHNAQVNDIAGTDDFAMRTITFDDVSFKYPGSSSAMVLSDISFEIPAGKVTALAGASGCGKSTVIKLLMRFFEPKDGNVRMGGCSIYGISESAWTGKVGAVLQNGKIFSGTILSNIALSDETPDHDKAMTAARLACIDDFINSLPLGMHSRIGKTGLDLSGGQQQRILIARAIYRNPEVLILDEATSSIDAVTEAKIMTNIYEYFKGRTLIIAAHRLSTIRDADNIVVLDNGCIVEQGMHEQLLRAGGVYSSLVNRQM